MGSVRTGVRAGWIAGLVALAAACASDQGAPGQAAGRGGTLFYLGAGKVFSLAPDGGQPKLLVDETVDGRARGVNDGIAVDVGARQLYWTNMGKAAENDGTVTRANLDGTNRYQVVEPGGAFTPKQIKLDLVHKKMYWADREGMAVKRANLDGSDIEWLVATGDPIKQAGQEDFWCVGLALDVARGQVYWTQKGGTNAGVGLIRRANMDIPKGQSAYNRQDIETLFSRLPEPIDLDLDLKSRVMYWTDRGDNTVSRAPMDPPKNFDPAKRLDRQVLVRGLHQPIGVALDLKSGRMAYTSLSGEVGIAKMDGSSPRIAAANQGMLTGVAWVN